MKKWATLLLLLVLPVVAVAMPTVQIQSLSGSDTTCGTPGTCTEVYKGNVALNTSTELDTLFQNDVGSVCAANNYVYGVQDDGTLQCRADQSGGTYDDTWINSTIDAKDVAANNSLTPYILWVNTTNSAGTSYDDAWINGTIDQKELKTIEAGNVSGSKWINYSNPNSTQFVWANNNLTIRESWLDSLYARLSNLVAVLGNWSLDKPSYTATSNLVAILGNFTANHAAIHANMTGADNTLNATKASITQLEYVNGSKLNVSDQRYNDTVLISTSELKTIQASNVSGSKWMNYSNANATQFEYSNNNLTLKESWLDGRGVAVRVYDSAGYTTSNGVEYDLTFDSEYFDTRGMHSTASNTGRLTAVVTGYYLVTCQIRWGYDVDGKRQMSIKNQAGTVLLNDVRPPLTPTNIRTDQSGSVLVQLDAGEYVTCHGTQTAGGNLDLEAASAYCPVFSATLIR